MDMYNRTVAVTSIANESNSDETSTQRNTYRRLAEPISLQSVSHSLNEKDIHCNWSKGLSDNKARTQLLVVVTLWLGFMAADATDLASLFL